MCKAKQLVILVGEKYVSLSPTLSRLAPKGLKQPHSMLLNCIIYATVFSKTLSVGCISSNSQNKSVICLGVKIIPKLCPSPPE